VAERIETTAQLADAEPEKEQPLRETVVEAPQQPIKLASILPPPAADIEVTRDRVLTSPASNPTPLRTVALMPKPAVVTNGGTGSSPLKLLKQYLVPILLGLAAVETAIIGLLIFRPPATQTAAAAPVAVTIDGTSPGSRVFVNDRAAGQTPLKVTLDGTARSIRVENVAPVAAAAVPTGPNAVVVPTGNDATAATLAQAAARQRSGGVRFTSSIPLQVLEGNRVLGSTDQGPVVTTAGTHQLDLVNTELGFRTRQSVTVRAGEIASFTVVTPMGRLSLNAQPWAQVWVDQNAVGETPIANLTVALGQHEVTFRHPQLGERKEIVIVRADTVTRLSTTFGR
jgi:hypothetical protein